MALSPPHRFIIRELFKRGLLPQNGALLEIGEANWYGQFSAHEMASDIKSFVPDPLRRESLHARMIELIEQNAETMGFDVVKLFYEVFFSPCEVQAIDMGGTTLAHRFDLNLPVQLNRRFHVTINHGTAEHIFNIPQVFKTMHDWTLPGGLMIHESPFTGWIDHGFYNLQPTLFCDLAEANGYFVRAIFIENIGANSIHELKSREEVQELARSRRIQENSMLLTVLSKADQDSQFTLPFQAYYRRSLSPELMTAWNEAR